MKKLIAILITAVMVVSLCTVFASAEEENIAVGKSYVTKGIMYQEETEWGVYPDTDGKKLTDGTYAESVAYSDAAWVGFNGNCREYNEANLAYIIVDLGEATAISKVLVSVNNVCESGIGAPAGFTYYVSEDNSSWSKLGEGTYSSTDEGIIVTNSIEMTVSARYVKAEFTVGGGGAWMFIDEIEIYAGNADDIVDPPSEDPAESETPEESETPADSETPSESVAESSAEDTSASADNAGFPTWAIVVIAAVAVAVIVAVALALTRKKK